MSEASVAKICSFANCARHAKKRGMCDAHYRQWRKRGQLTPLRRMRKFGSDPIIDYDERPCPNPELKGPCHVVRCTNPNARYGATYHKGVQVSTHRYVWEKENGPIPDGLVVDHVCRVKMCCNKDHLRLVTNAVNAMENSIGSPAVINSEKTQCKRGHPFDAENTYIHNGRRICRECARLANKKARIAKKSQKDILF